MIPARGRPKSTDPNKSSHKYCCFGTCKSDSRSKKAPTDQKNIVFIAFPKPCNVYRDQQCNLLTGGKIPPLELHKISSCAQCSKCALWIQLARRKDNGLSKLTDVTKHTFVCSLHFVNGEGPTDIHPNPLPANARSEEYNMNIRKPPRDRSTSNVPRQSKRRIVDIGPPEMPKFAVQDNYVPVICEPDLPIETMQDYKLLVPASSQTETSFDFINQDTFADWAVQCNGKSTCLLKMKSFDWGKCAIAELNVSNNFEVSLSVFGKIIPSDDAVMKSVAPVKDFGDVRTLMTILQKKNYCSGITEPNYKAAFQKMKNVCKGYYCQLTNSVRSQACTLFCNGVKCIQCRLYSNALNVIVKRQLKPKKEKASRFCNNRFLSLEDLKSKMECNRQILKTKDKQIYSLKEKIRNMESESHYLLELNHLY